VLDVCKHFGVPAMVCINKYDLNDKNTLAIHDYCREKGVDVAAMIPFDNAVTEAMVKGVSVVEYSEGRVTREIRTMWQHITKTLEA
jgi:MinD superfamily P-loop ATPase